MSAPSHHKRQEVCSTRSPYREGRRPKAVKVYTVNQESRYLLVQGVPAVGASHELIKLFAVHGTISEYRILDDYPAEHFTEVYLIKFERIQAARIAKRKLDDWSFFGGVLHVCYAPEYESVQDTREKLQNRRKAIAAKVRQYERDGTYSSPSTSHEAPTDQSKSQNSQTYLDKRSHNTPTNFAENFNRETQERLQIGFPAEQSASTQHTNYVEPSKAHTSGYNAPMYKHPFDQSVSLSHSARMQTPEGTAPASSMDYWSNHNRHVASVSQLSNTSSVSEVSGPAKNAIPDGNQWNYTPETTVTTNLDQYGSYGTEGEQLKLPLPPRQMHHGMSRHNQRLQNYTFACVPTAQAEFPVDYDARLNHPKHMEFAKNQMTESRHEISKATSEKPNLNDKVIEKADTLQALSVEVSTKTDEIVEDKRSMQEKIEENLKKKSDLVIKSFDKTRPVPKFIPRQAQIKKKPQETVSKETENGSTKNVVTDQLNKEIRRNAFTLGKPQGPVDHDNKLVKEVKKTEQSVDKTVKDIRKRMLQLSENKDILAKRKRVTEHTKSDGT